MANSLSDLVAIVCSIVAGVLVVVLGIVFFVWRRQQQMQFDRATVSSL